MDSEISYLRTSCSKIHFGAVNISGEEKKFCSDWSGEIISLCKSLPNSTQTDALLFLMRYSKASFKDLNLFRLYYVPAWSIIYWLIKFSPNKQNLTLQDIKNAKSTHFMAMFLHALDDHLNDQQIPVTHLTLLLRSQAWVTFNNAGRALADGLDGGEVIIQDFIDDYYFSIRSDKDPESLNEFCERFRKQMATWFIAPVILARKITRDDEFSMAVQRAYGSFGIAWRILDDIQDLETDMNNGAHSSIFVCLPQEMQKLWTERREQPARDNSRFRETIWDCIHKENIIGTLKERISSELKSAASIADNNRLSGLAEEFSCLLQPLA
jgi:hypothetical protein